MTLYRIRQVRGIRGRGHTMYTRKEETVRFYRMLNQKNLFSEYFAQWNIKEVSRD